jgi:hypothetical protein
MKLIRLMLPKAGSGFCRACDSPIDWYETPAGKRMPVESGALPLLLEGSGSMLEVGTFKASDAHWSNCPKASEFHR